MSSIFCFCISYGLLLTCLLPTYYLLSALLFSFPVASQNAVFTTREDGHPIVTTPITLFKLSDLALTFSVDAGNAFMIDASRYWRHGFRTHIVLDQSLDVRTLQKQGEGFSQRHPIIQVCLALINSGKLPVAGKATCGFSLPYRCALW